MECLLKNLKITTYTFFILLTLSYFVSAGDLEQVCYTPFDCQSFTNQMDCIGPLCEWSLSTHSCDTGNLCEAIQDEQQCVNAYCSWPGDDVKVLATITSFTSSRHGNVSVGDVITYNITISPGTTVLDSFWLASRYPQPDFRPLTIVKHAVPGLNTIQWDTNGFDAEKRIYYVHAIINTTDGMRSYHFSENITLLSNGGQYNTMTSYIPNVATITSTITDLGSIIKAFATELPGPILSLVIPFVILGAIVGLIGIIVTILPKVVNGALGRVMK